MGKINVLDKHVAELIAAGEQVYKIKINDVYWKDLTVFFVK